MFNQKKRTLAQFGDSSDDDVSAGGMQVIRRVKKRVLKPTVIHDEDSSVQEVNPEKPQTIVQEDESEDEFQNVQDHFKANKLVKNNELLKNKNEESSQDEEVYPTLKQDSDGSEYRYYGKDRRFYLPGDFSIPSEIYENLFDHQKDGVKWLYNLWETKKGGVLGDDMGLGKTVQVAAYLKGLFDSDMIKKVLIVVPATMKSYWEEELNKWCKDCTKIMQFDDKKKSNRYDQMKGIRKQGGILITSYGMITTEIQNLTDMRYDIIVVDEGHKAKNKNTQFRRDITSLKVKGHRVILSGTPLQNNLSELWSIFDFVQPRIFGNYDKFQMNYVGQIEKGLLKDSTYTEKQVSKELSKNLRALYQDHFLRRTKAQIFKIVCAETLERPLKLQELPLKTDLVIWVPLTDVQKSIYKFIIEYQQMKQMADDHGWEIKTAFSMLSYLKKLILHPWLLTTGSSMEQKMEIGYISYEDEMILRENRRLAKQNEESNNGFMTRGARKASDLAAKEKPAVKQIQVKIQKDTKEDLQRRQAYQKYGLKKIFTQIENMHKNADAEDLINVSIKTKFLFTLMAQLKSEGHRVLIFSMSKKMLDLLELIIGNMSESYKHLRIDGDTEIATREGICKQFNADPSIFCCLLTTKVGGFGLNLTGADRAIIMDPDWNPANDNQAVDRCYRIGQKKDVIVYRLVAIGGLEERIYRRQIHKKGMNLQTVENIEGDAKDEVSDEKAMQKYFNDSDLSQLFEYNDNDSECETLGMILKNDGFAYKQTPTNKKHIEYLRKGLSKIVKGITLNSNLYTAEEEKVEVVKNGSQNSSVMRDERDLSRTSINSSRVMQYEAPSIYKPVLSSNFKMNHPQKPVYQNKPYKKVEQSQESHSKENLEPKIAEPSTCEQEEKQSERKQQKIAQMRQIHQNIYAQYNQDQCKPSATDFIRTTSTTLSSKSMSLGTNLSIKQSNHCPVPPMRKDNKSQPSITSMFARQRSITSRQVPNSIAKY